MRRAVPISILLVLVFVASSCAPRQKSTTVGPNVLIVITDDERYGSEEATPRLREWFDEGAIFTRAYATTPHCCPSRVSILTGKYVHNHGVPHPRKIRELDHDTTMQQQLLAAGYATGFIGKYINGWDPFRRPLGIERSTLGVGYERTPFVRDGVAVMAEYGPSFVFREGRTFVNEWEREDEKPWLLTISPFAPHEPFLPEDSYSEVDYPWDGTPATDEEDRTDKPRYVQRNRYTEGFGQSKRESQFRTLRTIDDEFMETIAHLERLGELNDTLVIYASDNGYMWADHGLIGKGVPYEGSVHIPIYMRGPGVEKQVVDQLVANIDIAPTVYDAVGIEPDYEVDGRPLLRSSRDTLLLEFEGGSRVPSWNSLISHDWQYTEYEDGFREFYDLEEDRYQLENRPDDAPAELRALLSAATDCAGAKCP